MSTAIENVYVTGDPTIDWAVEHPVNADLEDRLGGEATGRWHRGGALLLQNLLGQALEDTDVKVHGFRTDLYPFDSSGNQQACPSPVDTFTHHSYNELLQGPCKDEHANGGWRVVRTIGFHKTRPLAGYARPSGDNRGGGLRPQMVVVDDLGVGFGESKPLCEPILERIDREECQWTILRLHGLFGRGFNGRALDTATMNGSNHLQQEIFQRIGGPDGYERMADRVVVIIEARSLREEGFEVSRGLSWERSGQDVLAAIAGHRTLSRFRYVVINFGPTGALLIEQPREDGGSRSKVAKTVAHLHFDRSTIEDVWEREREQKHKSKDDNASNGATTRGRMFGYTNILTAAIARGLIEGSTKVGAGRRKDARTLIGESIDAGLRGMRLAEANGFILSDPGNGAAGEFTYPSCMNREATTKLADESKFTDAEIQPLSMGNPPGNWSILGDMAREPGLAYRAAAKIARGGPIGPDGVPYAKFGNLLVVDRGEVETLRTVYNLIAQYLADDSQKPLSVAVFGAPGDGKSFAVKELVKAIPQRSLGEPLEFNLSQLSSPSDLAYALHQVQDGTSEGNVPLVFWDEFDTSLDGQALGWLRYFLSPMEDGTFQERDRRHPIGRAVFVFAGGTSKRYQEFVDKATSPQCEYAKGMDFLSRLRGYLEIVGPNPRDCEFVGYSKYIYRAVLLNAALKMHGLTETHIDEGVLQAFLTVGGYRHGARSLRAIVDMSSVHKRGTFGISSLPPDTQLDLHVNATEFLRIARGSNHDEVLSSQL